MDFNLETYDEARKKIVAAEQTSDLSGAENNDLPNKRARIRQPPMPVGSDGDSDDSENERVVKKGDIKYNYIFIYNSQLL